MPIGNPISLTRNVASREVSVTATAGQTLFTVTGGYRINAIDVYRNGVKLAATDDFTALDGSSVTLTQGAVLNDELVFRLFDDFRVSDAIVSAASTQVINGDLSVTGTLSASIALDNRLEAESLKVTGVSTLGNVKISGGIVTATSGVVTYFGDGSQLSNVVSGVQLFDDDVSVGTGITQINFSGATLTHTASGITTVSINKTLTIGRRSGAEVINLVGTGMTLALRSGVGTVNF